MLCLHATSDPSGGPWGAYPTEDRYAPLVLRTFLYMARTELFIVISCFLLMFAIDRRPRTYGQVLQEQCQRLLLPFLFWTVFFAGYGLIKAQAFGYFDNALSDLASVKQWARNLLLGDVKYHMHFLPTLFGVVLFYPLFRLAVRYPALGLSILVCLVSKNALDAFIYRTFWGTELLGYLVRAVKIFTYIGYGMLAGAALGVWQRTTAETRKEWFPILMWLGVLLLLFKLIAAWKTAQSGEWTFTYVPAYWADFLFPVVLFGGCMTLAHLRWPEIISRIAPYSFGLYLCHPIFHDLYEIAMQNGTDLSPISQIGLKVGFTLVMTSVLVFIISKTKMIAWTIGMGPLPRMRVTGLFKGEKTNAH